MHLTERQRIHVILYLLEKNGPMLKRDIHSEIERLGFGATHEDRYKTMVREHLIDDSKYRLTITDTGRRALLRLFVRTFPAMMKVLYATDVSN